MIIDSSSLIIFAKINRLYLLLKLYKSLYISNGVYNEVVEEGMKINAPDAIILRNFVEAGKIKILSLIPRYNDFSRSLEEIYPQLGKGECEVIALSLQEKNKEIVMDETLARGVAKLYGIKTLGSLRVLLEAYKRKFIEEWELREIVSEMIKNKFRVGADLMDRFWKVFDTLKKSKGRNNHR